MNFCNKIIASKSQYAEVADHKCHCIKGHTGKCNEFPFLEHLKATAPSVANKIKRDATMTTGAAWKSEDAGPNRILRWVMMLDDNKLLKYGLDMSKLKPGVIAKLREKAADYDSCILVAAKLTWLVYQMENAPTPPEDIKSYLEDLFGEMKPGSTLCVICRLPLDFKLFELAARGKAAIETCHKNPRMHNADNVGFGHRECNIAQGNKSLDEFYSWIEGIIERVNSKS